MNLVIDIGNTQTKVAVFKGNEIIFDSIYPSIEISDLEKIVQEFSIKQSIVSSVKNTNQQLVTFLSKKTKFISFSHQTLIPLTLKYTTPNTLGLDRIAAAVAANVNNSKNMLIIDIGTCVTFDYINNRSEYLGGAISPGINIRLKALNQFTDKLPLIENIHNYDTLIGNSTENSIKSGIYFGLQQEILGVINLYEKQYKDLNIVITGGDLKMFDLEAKNRIFADKFLVLKGLNEILNYNAKD